MPKRTIQQEASSITNNRLGEWWCRLSDTARAALLRDVGRMKEHAFKAGAEAALRDLAQKAQP